jgi:hypothetical protein
LISIGIKKKKELDRLQSLNAVASNGLRAPHLNLNSIRQSQSKD